MASRQRSTVADQRGHAAGWLPRPAVPSGVLPPGRCSRCRGRLPCNAAAAKPRSPISRVGRRHADAIQQPVRQWLVLWLQLRRRRPAILLPLPGTVDVADLAAERHDRIDWMAVAMWGARVRRSVVRPSLVEISKYPVPLPRKKRVDRTGAGRQSFRLDATRAAGSYGSGCSASDHIPKAAALWPVAAARALA
jgi:hypothetical protein